MPPSAPRGSEALHVLEDEITACRGCPRLVDHREYAARVKVARFADEEYWGRPVPGFGDPRARIALVGLAPAANGANRTGRMFTGDRSGDFLYASLFRVGLASQAASVRRGDGLSLEGVWVTAINRCAPPANKPTPEERERCLPFLERELALLPDLRVIVPLGAYAWDGALRALRHGGDAIPVPKPKFGHGAEARIGHVHLLGTYHPSQQNTFTGTLTEEMLDAVFRRAVELAEEPSESV